MSEFNFENLFEEEITSNSLSAGIHENVKLISVDVTKRKDFNGKTIKKQLFLKFKKYTEEGEDIGEKEIDFFLLDPEKKDVIKHLKNYLDQVLQLLRVYYTDDELFEGEKPLFDPYATLYDPKIHNLGEREDGMDSDFAYDNIKKKVLDKNIKYKEISEAINNNIYELLKDRIGVKSRPFRLKLIESKDGEFIQIPLYSDFIERSDISKEDSKLYN
jgi:hypothetical protein